MKHTLKVTLILVAIFFFSQIIGLAILNEYIDIQKTSETGKTIVNSEVYKISGIEPPKVDNESLGWIMVMLMIFIGTALVLLIIRFKQGKIWKIWFLVAIFFCLRYAFAPFIHRFISLFPSVPLAYAAWISIAVALFFALYKVFWPNIYVHNFTELFIYGGLAAILMPIINITAAFIILLLISIYDMFAVWQSKHMVKMAKYQTESRMFAGLMLHYDKESGRIGSAAAEAPAKTAASIMPGKKSKVVVKVAEETKTAILGGGDIAFPLLFSGAVMKLTGGYTAPFIVVVTTTIALFLLLFYAKKDRFYPAMPFISAGCFVGYLCTLLM